MNNGNVNNNNKTNTNRVRAVAPVPSSATPQAVYDIPFSTIIEAWIDCERNKRSSNSCTKFRWHSGRDNFFRKSPEAMWADLPPRKSLFHMDGLEIGNLPNQIWANFLGAVFTMWMIFVKKVDGFIIFVDDFKFLGRSAEDGRRLIKEIREFLVNELHITLHPDKIYLQHYTKGTKFVGAVIKPPCNRPSALNHVKHLRKWVMRGLNHDHIVPDKFRRFLVAHLSSRPRSLYPGRIYVSNRTRGHFISSMKEFNNRAKTHRERLALLEKVRASINSYLGLMGHYNSYKVRRKICEQHILPTWGKYLYFVEDFSKCVLRREYDKTYIIRKRLKNRRYAAKFIRPKWSPD